MQGTPRAVVSPLGFDEKFIMRMVARYNIGRGDAVVLLTLKPTEKTLKAYNLIRMQAHNIGFDVKCLKYTGTESFPGLVAWCKKVLHDLAKDYRLIVGLSAGMRALVVSLYTAVLLSPSQVKDRIDVVEIESESSDFLLTVPGELIRLVGVTGNVAADVLKALIEAGQADVRTLAKALGKDDSTVRRQLSDLVKLGLASYEQQKTTGRKLYVASEAALAVLDPDLLEGANQYEECEKD